jgi:phage terminase small subunit
MAQLPSNKTIMNKKTEELLNNMTPKQSVFCLEYLKTNDIPGSYAKAYRSKNENEARRQGFYLLNNTPEIIEFFAHQQAQLAQKYQMTLEQVVEKHMLIVKSFEELLSLTEAKTLTKEESLKLQNLSNIVKASDYRNALIEISKLKQQYVNVVDFTTSTKVINIQISNTLPIEVDDAEEVDFTEISSGSSEQDGGRIEGTSPPPSTQPEPLNERAQQDFTGPDDM